MALDLTRTDTLKLRPFAFPQRATPIGLHPKGTFWVSAAATGNTSLGDVRLVARIPALQAGSLLLAFRGVFVWSTGSGDSVVHAYVSLGVAISNPSTGLTSQYFWATQMVANTFSARMVAREETTLHPPVVEAEQGTSVDVIGLWPTNTNAIEYLVQGYGYYWVRSEVVRSGAPGLYVP